jgi:hypothetical protein
MASSRQPVGTSCPLANLYLLFDPLSIIVPGMRVFLGIPHILQAYFLNLRLGTDNAHNNYKCVCRTVDVYGQYRILKSLCIDALMAIFSDNEIMNHLCCRFELEHLQLKDNPSSMCDGARSVAISEMLPKFQILFYRTVCLHQRIYKERFEFDENVCTY